MTYDNWKTTDPADETLGPAPLSERDRMLAEAAVAVGEIVHTNHEYPPIPIRSFDWSATLDSYSGEPSDPIGYGATEAEAVRDLVEQVEEDR